MQLELDRYAEEFRSLHAERHEVVQHLDNLLTTMHHRDIDIHTLAEVRFTSTHLQLATGQFASCIQ